MSSCLALGGEQDGWKGAENWTVPKLSIKHPLALTVVPPSQVTEQLPHAPQSAHPKRISYRMLLLKNIDVMLCTWWRTGNHATVRFFIVSPSKLLDAVNAINDCCSHSSNTISAPILHSSRATYGVTRAPAGPGTPALYCKIEQQISNSFDLLFV